MNYTASEADQSAAKLPGWRASLLFALILLALAGLLVRAFYLQGIHDEFLQEKGNQRYSRVVEVSAHRGMLTDRNGEPLAVSTPVESVWASPSVIKMGDLKDAKMDEQQLVKLAQLLSMRVSEVHDRLADTTRDFVYLKRQLPPDQASEVSGLNLAGISLKREYRRYYPAGEEIAQTLGFTGQDDNGQEGLELALQGDLAGKPGSQRVIKDRRGHMVEDAGSLQPPKPGADIMLSLDLRVQHLAYRELKLAVQKNKAKAGAVVVLDARSGEVLALANYPSYNPNNRAQLTPEQMRNRAVADMFEPGSTMKPFTVATALETGKVKPDTVINTENGVLTIANKKIHDTHPEPFLTVAQVIQKSSNVGASKIALSLEPSVLWQTFSDAGFGAHTGSNFPGEAIGMLRDAHTWKPIEQATMSYGHGISVNLLQLTRAYTAFAGDGDIKPVSLVKLDAPAVGKRVFSEKTVGEMRAMLESVVLPGGTAPMAQIAGYRVAGKTGTAHKLEGHHYSNRYVASFVGFAPVSKPRVIVAVMIDEPEGGQYYGGLVAAPVFSQIAGETLRMYNVPNDAPLDNVIVPPTDADSSREEV
ncbi:MAG: penicillin-binding protein 2 [Gallionella sp.]|nr:penicillin-binding protein 2 [Gallionella sp.]MDD4946302.1 penicillin-binding protein 2 [Gallionella sp.]